MSTALPEGEVHVWRAELDRGNWPDAAGLPAAERERAARFSSARARERWVASRWALRVVLGRYLGKAPAAIGLRLGSHGKPALADPFAGLCFNLSHSGGLALVAVSLGREVGVDVERVRPRRNVLKLADRALSPPAATTVHVASPAARLTAFHLAWTRREAIAKCLGTGLREPISPAPVAVLPVDAGPGFAAAVAAAGDAVPPLRLFAFPCE